MHRENLDFTPKLYKNGILLGSIIMCVQTASAYINLRRCFLIDVIKTNQKQFMMGLHSGMLKIS